jgi:hypothetical protein
VGPSSWAASPEGDGVDVQRSAPTSTAASLTSLVASGPGKNLSSPDLESGASSGSDQARLLPLPDLLRRSPLVKILGGIYTDSM